MEDATFDSIEIVFDLISLEVMINLYYIFLYLEFIC